MNSELAKNVLILITTSIPLVNLILILIKSRIEGTTEPLDSPSLKIFKIKRYPIDVRDLKRLRWGNYWNAISAIIYLVSGITLAITLINMAFFFIIYNRTFHLDSIIIFSLVLL